MRKRKLYKVVGSGPWGVEKVRGGMLYDLIESWTLAVDICAALNSGCGQDWEEVEAWIERNHLAGTLEVPRG